MMVNIIEFIYEGSEKERVQGKKSKINRYKKNGFYAARGGNGTIWMTKPSVAEVKYTVGSDTTVYTGNVKGLIKEHYNLDRLTKSRFDDFKKECKDGNIELKISDEGNLYI